MTTPRPWASPKNCLPTVAYNVATPENLPLQKGRPRLKAPARQMSIQHDHTGGAIIGQLVVDFLTVSETMADEAFHARCDPRLSH
jgi:hypothetical protein